MGVQHAGDINLPETCMLNVSVLSSAVFLLHFLSKVPLAVPSKKHLDPLGRSTPKREIHEPLLHWCKTVALPKKWWG